MNKSIIIGVIAFVLLAGGGYMLLHSNTDDSSASTTDTSTTTPPPTNNTNEDTQAAATITYTSSGFSPSTTTVKAGDTVTIKNASSTEVQFESDPHPQHTDDEDLNVGIVQPGESKTFTVTKTGTFGIHNHLNSSETATIIVQ